jgi:REP element-mobilizing transposase RayT
MELNETGKIIENIWESLPDHHPVELDVFQIMPNHIHFIIQIVDTGRSRPTPTLGTIVGLFKSECTKQINIVVGTTRGSSARGSSIWQRNYYEHIIRNEVDLNKIREYILFNPQMWERDRNNLKNHLI